MLSEGEFNVIAECVECSTRGLCIETIKVVNGKQGVLHYCKTCYNKSNKVNNNQKEVLK